MAQLISYICSCGWSGEVLLGPTMTQPARPLPHVCTTCKDIFLDEICPNCITLIEPWDMQTCPSCNEEVQETFVAMVD